MLTDEKLAKMSSEGRPTVAAVWSNRSEEGLLRPVIEELRKDWEVWEWRIPDNWFDVPAFFHEQMETPDLAICPYDRPPVTLAAYFLYHARVPIAQLHAGDISSGTFDDMDRWCITAWAKYHFCAGEDQAERVKAFLDVIRRPKPWYVHVSGVTNLDDIENMAEPPDGDYDVVLYNPPTAAPELMATELAPVFNLLDKETYWLVPNGDPGSLFISEKVQAFAQHKPIVWTPTMPHESLLGLLSRAKRVIGNSSALFFEAPYFRCDIIHVGERNRIREHVKLEPGGSRRIAEKLREWTS